MIDFSAYLNGEKKISKEEVNELPLCRYEGKIVTVSSREALMEAVKDLAQYHRIGFDTETRPSTQKGFSNSVALLQLSTPKTAYLIHLHKTGFPIELQWLMSSADHLKVGIALLDDIRGLQEYADFEPQGFVDLAEVAKEKGFQQTGARNLAGILMGVRISKTQQTSNWEKYPLSQGQKFYAATDAWLGPELLQRFEQI
ncbi:3'-5' exonuclease [Persicobacter diffluens]|uniref:3'-exoribonuclease n=1 Tax=Persicobacter diffluens TaxID=981 RepID=A0AAN4VXH6_9BACT|nr:3'-exoribonuclease [Persicobacter diffluens]